MKRLLLTAVLCAFLGAAFAQTSPTAMTDDERLFDAIDENKELLAEGLVVRGKANVNARNADRETPLHRAVEKAMPTLVKTLIARGADMRARSKSGETVLHLAGLNADQAFADMLLAAGADAKARNDDGETALHWAAMSGNLQTATRLLAAGVDANVRDIRGNTALHGAADGEHEDLVKLLLPRIAEPAAPNKDGKTPADLAGARGNSALARLLGAAPRRDIPAAGSAGGGFQTMPIDDPRHPTRQAP
jgi:ankyrin repeat protein